LNRSRFIAVLTALVCLLGVQAAYAQNVAIVAGNGQVICPGCQGATAVGFQSMVVKLTDANGNPLSGQQVNWTTTGATIATPTTFTQTDGTSSNTLFAGVQTNSNAFQSYNQYTVTAQAGNSTATFFLTQGIPDPFNQLAPAIQVVARNVPVGGVLSGQIGTASSTVLQLSVSEEHGFPIPNVGMFLVNTQDPTVGPTVQCQATPGAGPNVVLSDATGFLSCTPIFGGTPGKGQFSVLVGGAYPGGDPTQIPEGIWNSLPLNITATPGSPGSVNIKQGTPQTVISGQAAPLALVAEVDGTGGQPLSGIGVKWTVTPAGAANLSNTSTASDLNGRVSTNVNLSGSAFGTITVTVTLTSDSTKSATFTINAVQPVTITTIQAVSGGNQAAAVNTAFAQPLVVQLTVTSGSPAGIPVQFQVTQGSVSLSATTASTDANGRASVTATAGSFTGTANVVASVASNAGIGSVTFVLSVAPSAPNITAGAFVNGADFQGNSLSPCSIGALVTSAGTLGVTPLSPVLPGLTVPAQALSISIGNIAAPVLNITNNAAGQQLVTFQVPCNAPVGGSVPVAVSVGGGTSPVNLNIQAASPGVFQTQMSDGIFRAVLVRPDGSFVSLENPARRGETEVAYVTGLGTTAPPSNTLSVAAPGAAATVQGSVIAGMNGGGVPLNYAQLSEDLVGVFVVSIQIPPDMATGPNVTFSVGLVPVGSTTPIYSATSKIPVQ